MTSGCVVEYDGQVKVFIKGSYEKINMLCKRNTIPADYSEQTEMFAKNQYYVLGIGMKILHLTEHQKLADLTRDDLEQDIEFVGLLMFLNEVKSDSHEAINDLNDGTRQFC